MPSTKKPADDKRASLPRSADYAKSFVKGEWADHRECHIGGDFLLIYQIWGNSINFVRAGTHAELFE